MKTLIICGSHPRHYFILKPLFKEFKNIKCIMMERESVKFGPEYQYNNALEKKLLNKHFYKRFTREKKIFGIKNISEKFLKKEIMFTKQDNLNSIKTLNFIKSFKPDVCFIMGSGILKKKIMKVLPKLTINIHLGLSPWYRGSATLFWPSYNLEPWKTGVTFHKIDQNIDSGPILHQSVPKLKKNMGVVDLSIAAIIKARNDFKLIIKRIKNQKKLIFKQQSSNSRTYLTKTFRAVHLKLIYEFFDDKIVDYFLKQKRRIPKVNLIQIKLK